MGNHSTGDSPTQNTIQTCIYNSNMKLLLILVPLFASSQAAPQYGPVGGQQGDGTGPQQQRAPAAPARTKCRTEYTTIWDTEYVETENQVCTTVYVNECNTLYKKQCQNVPREVCTTVNDRQCSTVYRDVNTIGRVKGKPRCGFPSLEPVSPTPTTPVWT